MKTLARAKRCYLQTQQQNDNSSSSRTLRDLTRGQDVVLFLIEGVWEEV